MMESQQSQQQPPLMQVLVTNIPPTANEQTLASFFSFCGTITNLKLTAYGGERGSEAIVSFDSEAAAKTALLLTNAVIADRPITVVPYGPASGSEGARHESSSASAEGHTTEISGADIPNKQHAAPAEERSKISVVASLIAAGYTVGEDAIAKARQIDEQSQLSTKVGQAAAATRDSLRQLDETYKISETVGHLTQDLTHKAREVDQNWKISENVSHVMKNVSDTVEVLSNRAKESPVVQTTVSKLSQMADNVGQYLAPITQGVQAMNTRIVDTTSQIKEQSSQLIEQKHRERTLSANANNPNGENAATTTTTTATTTSEDDASSSVGEQRAQSPRAATVESSSSPAPNANANANANVNPPPPASSPSPNPQ